jgi:hypothetical protein
MGKFFIATLLAIALANVQEAAAVPCTGFKWDVRQEVALFAGTAAALPAGKNAATAPALGIDRLYALTLLPQSQVNFVVAPGKNAAQDSSFAGLAELRVPAPGNYRVALDAPVWIDVIVDGKLAQPTDYQGQHSCPGPHKIVEFDLSGAQHFTLQLSGSADAAVRMTVTRTPPRKL